MPLWGKRRALVTTGAAVVALSLAAGTIQAPAAQPHETAAEPGQAVRYLPSALDALVPAAAVDAGQAQVTDAFGFTHSAQVSAKAKKKAAKKAKSTKSAKAKKAKKAKKSKKAKKKAKKSKKTAKSKKAKKVKKTKKIKKAPAKKTKKAKKKSTRKYYDSSRKIATVNGSGAKGTVSGTSVQELAVQYLAGLGARDVVVRWDLSCPAKRGMIYTNGRVSAIDTSVMRLCVSGPFDSTFARNSLRFLVAHEYAHLLQNRAFGAGTSLTYQSVAKTEKQADCAAAAATGLSVRTYGTYASSCPGSLGSSARTLVAGGKPASLGR